MERLFSLYVNNNEIRNYTPEEVLRLFKDDGGLKLEVNGINLMIQYVPDRSIETGDVYDIIADIEDEGYEVKALIHDYVESIRASNSMGEYRLELGQIIKEWSTLAKIKRIPIITAAQLNRQAMDIIQSAIESGKQDIISKLNGSQIGEAFGVLKNGDYTILIYKELDQITGKW